MNFFLIRVSSAMAAMCVRVHVRTRSGIRMATMSPRVMAIMVVPLIMLLVMMMTTTVIVKHHGSQCGAPGLSFEVVAGFSFLL